MSTIGEVKSQLDEAHKRVEDVTGRLGAALLTLAEAQGLILSATEGSNNRAVEQMGSAIVEATEGIEEVMTTLNSGLKESQEYAASI